MRAYLWVMFGSVFGAGARYALSRYAAKVLSPDFPYGTLIINVTGSLILGWFMIWTTERVFADPRWRLIVAIGFCGSYTTFSSYAFESFALFEQGHLGNVRGQCAGKQRALPDRCPSWSGAGEGDVECRFREDRRWRCKLPCT